MDIQLFSDYKTRLTTTIDALDLTTVSELAAALKNAWRKNQQVFLCGNGGSAGNAAHIANDFIYGIGKGVKPGLRAHALSTNTSVITCLANDEGYEKIYSAQLKALAQKNDLLIVFSGSGNSPNVVDAIKIAKEMGVITFAITGFAGGKCRELADHSIHTPIEDMQISEDMQLVVMHMVSQWLMKDATNG